MKTKTLVITSLIVVFVIGVALAFWREIRREEETLARSISGIVEVSPHLFAQGVADVVRTDRLVLLLVDPQTQRPVALHFESPLVPPQTIRIGQDHARIEGELTGPYVVVGITDKDGEIFTVTPGEIYGRSPQPVPLGAEEFRLVLDQPYRGTLTNERRPQTAGAPTGQAQRQAPAAQADDPRFSVSGSIVASQAMQGRVERSDRLVVLLFDPELGRPAGFKIIPHAILPQQFTVSLQPQARTDAKPAYQLRVISDKDNNPFGAAEGEVVGRSAEPIPLGSSDVVLELNQPYVR